MGEYEGEKGDGWSQEELNGRCFSRWAEVVTVETGSRGTVKRWHDDDDAGSTLLSWAGNSLSLSGGLQPCVSSVSSLPNQPLKTLLVFRFPATRPSFQDLLVRVLLPEREEPKIWMLCHL